VINNLSKNEPVQQISGVINTIAGGFSYGSDVAPCGACRPWIFFINEVLCFLKFDDSGMEKENDDWRRHFNEKMSLEETHHHRKSWIRA